jgi:HPt (histidine-containing phosphotransfer) domain-containing protein
MDKNNRMSEIIQDDEIDAELLGIQQRFVVRLKAYVEELRALQSALESTETYRDACNGIYIIAHRLHGTAKTIGFARLGAMSAELELSVKQALAISSLPSIPDVRSLLDAYLGEIEAVIGKVSLRP